MGLSDFYHSLEDRYYSWMDGLESSGVKMYEWFINPIEDHGWPSMPFFFLGVLLILGLATVAVVSLSGSHFALPGVGGSSGVNVAVKVSSADGPLSGVVVSLTSGSSTQSAKTNADGVANFDSVPHADYMSVNVNQDGYDAFKKDFPVSSAKSSAVFTVSLEKSTPPSQSVELFVSDNQQQGLANAEVRFLDPSTGNPVVKTTDAQGKVSLSVSGSDPLNLQVSANGYESQTQTCLTSSSSCQVVLSLSSSPNPSTTPSSKSSVSFQAVDSQGNGVPGKAVLFRGDNGQTLDTRVTDSLGNARFDNIDVGVDVYVTFTPGNQSFSFQTSDTKTTTSDGVSITMTLNAVSNPGPSPNGYDLSKVTVQAVDVNKKLVPNVQAQLFLSSGTLLPVSDVQTGDDNGQVIFSVDPSAHVFATLWAPGFLPTRTRIMAGGDNTTQVMQQVLIGNHGSLNVSVVDDVGLPITGASVNFITSDGFPLGVPAQVTDSNGLIEFDNLPLIPLRAVAVLGSQSGQSDVVSVTLDSKVVSVTLVPAKAFVSASALDAINKTPLSATFTAALSATGSVIGSCTSTNGSSCSIQVPSGRNVVVQANSTGYGPMTSQDLLVQPSATYSQSFYLVPESLSNQLLVTNAAVLDQSGRKVTVLDKGRIYTFALQFNLPSKAQVAGAFVRVGTVSDAAKSPMVVSDYSKPADATIVKGQKFNPGPSCVSDLGDQNGPIAWVDWSYKTFGSQTVSADVFVLPTVTTKDQLVVQYRLYAQAGGAYVRNPEDSRFGGQQRTADLDSCYAQTISIPLAFVDGKSTCNNHACISTLFQSANGSATNGLHVDAGQLFNVSVDLRAFNALDSPFLKITTSPSLEFTGYDFGTATSSQGPSVASGQSVTLPLSFFQHTNGTLRLRSLLQTQNAQLNFGFGDASGDLLDASRYAVVQGTGTFQITPQPAEIQILLPNTLIVNVLSDSGIAVTDAHVALDETVASPFEGDPPSPIQGDGTAGQGLDGKYTFKNLKPNQVGQFDVVVSRDGFAEGRQSVGVNATDPLSFGQDISNVQLNCQNPTIVTVQSGVNVELKTFASFSGTGCAAVKAGSSSISTNGAVSGTSGTVSFHVKPGKDTNIVLTPVLNGNCVLTFNSQTLTGQTLGQQDMFISNTCNSTSASSGAAASTSVSPTPIPGQDCSSRGGQCVALGQSCPSGFVPSTYQASAPYQPYGTSPFGYSPFPSVTPAPLGICSTSNTQCCVPASQVCQSPVFNFQNIFAKYLGYYLGMQSLGTYPQQVTAASAPTQLVASQAGITLKPGKLSPSCTPSGNGLTCTKPIFALMPTNALAFSVENQLFTTTNILAKRQGTASCYAVQEVGKLSGFSSFYNGIVNDIASSAALLTRQTRTFVILFKPGPGCVTYEYDNEGWHVKPSEVALKGTDVLVSTTSALGGTQFKIHFVVDAKPHVSDKYVFIAMPVGGTVTMRGIQKAIYEEPAIFANNIPIKSYSALVKGSVDSSSNVPIVVPADNAVTSRLVLSADGQNSISVQMGKSTPVSLPVASKFVAGPAGLDQYDIVGNVASPDGSSDSLACSKTDFCTPDAVGNGADTGVLLQIKSDLTDLANTYVASVDTLAYEDPLGLNGGEGQAYQQLYQQALQDALREYSGLQGQYQACVGAGQNPLSGIQAQCAQTGMAPIYSYSQTLPGAYGQQGFYNGYNPALSGYNGLPYGRGLPKGGVNPALGQAVFNPYQSNFYPGPGFYPGYVDPSLQGTFGNAFGNGFSQAGCNSGILQAFQIQGALTPAYFDPIQQQLMQQYSYSRGVYSNNKPVLRDLQPVIKVPVKEAGSNGGIKVYSFKADLSNSGGQGDFVVIATLNSNPGLWSSYGTGNPSSNTPPKGSQTTEANYGYPYLKLNDAKNRYVLQNWNAPAYSSSAPKSTSGTDSYYSTN